jgi:predicted PolB exonuclease-like 3'-5' exonuclease
MAGAGMLKLLAPRIYAFDSEWIPDVETGRRLLDLADDMPDADVLEAMFEYGGGTAENPRPYLKTVLCRIVSIAAVKRTQVGDDVTLSLVSVPSVAEGALSEAVVVDRFLTSVGQTKPQLVGFNSASADLPAIIQRALVHRIAAPKFCARPAKPWEGVDYFVKHGDWSVDLKDVLTGAGYGKSTPSLNEIAAACGIPAKGSIDGSSVLDLWQLGEIAEIVRYNQRDALTTYLLLLRVLHLAGKIDLAAEEARVAVMLEQLARTEGNAHLRAFLDEWKPTTARAA